MKRNKKFGELIRSLREGQNLSQADLAKILGYDDIDDISLIEIGVLDMPDEKLYIMATHFPVRLSDLFKFHQS